MTEKLIKWFVFSVLIALIPFLWNWLSLVTREQPVNAEILFSRGELLLVSCAIAAAAVGELITSETVRKIYKILIGFACIAILMLNSLWFSQVALHILQSEQYNQGFVAYGSIATFILTTLSALSANYVAELE